ncbi:hypothetical protein F902_01686 [Acinetobacter higginsii]|uniref:Uncharacterized protein n=1 Tax=Acinetobacter higginsii TaxID=70347 RepID=N9T6P5_9GAMM|nr:hypothetical protein F902_01686 [Acinetobacter higginsii]
MTLMEILFLFAFIYPLVMAWTWMVGGLWFYFKREYKQNNYPRFQNKDAALSFLVLMNKLKFEKPYGLHYKHNIQNLKLLPSMMAVQTIPQKF